MNAPSHRPGALLTLLFVLLALVVPAAIQAQPARISITVVDPGGERWTFAERDIAKARLHWTW